MSVASEKEEIVYPVRVNAAGATLAGDLGVPERATGVVAFAHGSGSGRHSPRNRFVAQRLRADGLATLLVDLLTEPEELVDQHTGHLRFDIEFLARRVAGVVDWLSADPRTRGLGIGLFGASTGGGAALVAAARDPGRVAAVVSRGGRPDLAGAELPAVRCPTRLIVGGHDTTVIMLNEDALGRLGSEVKELVIIPGAGHLFEEPGKLDEVARLAAGWFTRYLRPDAS